MVVLQDIVVLRDDDEEEAPLQERRKKSGSSSRRRLEIPQSTPALEAVVERSGGPVRTNVTFASPLTTDRPSVSTA